MKTDIVLQILPASNKSYSVDTTICALNGPQECIRTGARVRACNYVKIRCCGYYFITILCGFYLRVATNREQHFLNSVLSVKSFVNVRALRKASFIRLTRNYNAVTWFSKQT